MDNSNTPKITTAATPLPTDDPRSPENIERRFALRIAERDPQGRLYLGSGIPGAGRKPDAETITALARVRALRAIEVLREVLDDPWFYKPVLNRESFHVRSNLRLL
ncbi:MAG: hypothetical protein WC100_17705 [Sterolibacterium sp.]